ncbi:MAG: apolipoprotein N-acyltransferase [Myxococcales bacterium FL481]|nr:MAG: apolipoprotein N-acyltransferase [Myxococcales bacterium FL481]
MATASTLRRVDVPRYLAAGACGCMMWLGVPDFDLWWLGFVGWLPWLWAIDGQSPRQAFKLGLFAGICALFVGYLWMTELLVRFGGIPMAPSLGIHLLFSTWQGSQWAFPAAIIAWLQRRGVSLLWSTPLAWTATEALLPNIFPTYMPLMWCWQPVLFQHAEIGGVTTVSFSMLAINAALYLVVRGVWATRKLDKMAAIAAAAWSLGVPAYGMIRLAQMESFFEDAKHVKVGVVQGNFGIRTYGAFGLKPKLLADMQRVSSELEAQGAELLLWGETAYPYSTFWRSSTSDLPLGHPRRLRRGFTVPLVAGVVTHDRSRDNPYPWNTAWILERDGSLGDRYDKNYPLMFGESVPFVDPEWYLDLIPHASYLNPGNGPAVLRVDGLRLGPLICYEDILPRFARAVALEGIHAFVNLTNDSWFGRTRAQGEHLGLAVFRTVEQRRAMLRSVNAGISAYIDPAGRVVEQTEVTNSDVDGWPGAVGFVADVPMIDPKHRSVYNLTGELFNGLCVLSLVVLGWRRRSRIDPRG